MNCRFFDPWVGSEYRSNGIGGVRILVLGESHYGGYDPQDVTNDFTSNIVLRWTTERRSAFFTKIPKILNFRGAGQSISIDEKISTWNKISFYNYIQVMLPRARLAPTDEMWAAARIPFQYTVEELKPHLILILGHRLVGNLPDVSKDVASVVTMHPSSSRFRYEETADDLRQKMISIQSNLRADSKVTEL